jgi:RNA polymerase sigma-70 factor (ECF subfamily)
MPDLTREPVDELALLERIVLREEAAFDGFYKLYYPRLFRFIHRVTRHPEMVEELIQETLLVIWERPEGFNHSSKISTWVFGIAYHKSLKAMANHRRGEAGMDLEEVMDFLADPSPTPAQTMETQDWLTAALAVLSPDHRAVVELTFHHGLHYREIAEIMNCPENTVKTRMFHARRKLQAFAHQHEE